ncbi:hypothetical protein [Saccharopolyspora elongata]|uniref:hypothetical protein n=1 Tax=Saccharopolyspora elongata TaxID=2530387 RepID=UPI001404F3AF|nr:hypothetical protein [Saccharopolyspora elongata]
MQVLDDVAGLRLGVIVGTGFVQKYGEPAEGGHAFGHARGAEALGGRLDLLREGVDDVYAAATVITLALFLFLIAQHGDFFAGADRSAGSSSAIMLVPSALAVMVAAVVWFATRRNGPAVTPKTV